MKTQLKEISSGTQDETEQLKAEIANLREQLARSQADYSNLVRRSREEQAQMTEWSENKTILKFLTILDNLERALEHTPEEFKSHSWTDGLVSIIAGNAENCLRVWDISYEFCLTVKWILISMMSSVRYLTHKQQSRQK
jgi:hypothetical protein